MSRSTVSPTQTRMHSRSKASDISILGGIIHLSSVSVDTLTKGDGAQVVGTTTATYGEMSIAGQGFSIGPDGIVAQGESTPIPGLNDDPLKALQQLGITITVPPATNEVTGLAATAAREGLRIEIDTKIFRGMLDGLPLSDLVDKIPDDAGQLKSVLGAAVGAAPKMVVLIGNARSETETVQPLDLGLGAAEETPAGDPAADPAAEEDPGATTPGADGGASGGAVDAPPTTSGLPTGGTSSGTDAPQTENTALSSGLPALASIPGALLFGGLALGALAGGFLRRMGLLALGGGTSCAHGLDSGLPDLRKA
jgi:hypothetical protein